MGQEVTETQLAALDKGGWHREYQSEAKGVLKWERDYTYVDEEVIGDEVVHQQTIGFVPKTGKWEVINTVSKMPPDRSGIYDEDPFEDDDVFVDTLDEAMKAADDWWY